MKILNKKGFSILEYILIILLLGIVFSLTSMTYNDWRQDVLLKNNKEEMRSYLLRAQQLASAAASSTDWGLHLEIDSYTLFQGSIYNPADSNNIVRFLQGNTILNPDTSLSDGAGGYTSDLIFIKFTGQTVNTGTISIIVPNQPSIFTSINIESLGVID
jgi:type II secretory pathway pseudopilin PulG